MKLKISACHDHRRLQESAFMDMHNSAIESGFEIVSSHDQADIILVTDLHHRNLYKDILARPEHVRNYDKLVCYYEQSYPCEKLPGIYTCGSINSSATRGGSYYFWLGSHAFERKILPREQRPYLFSFMGRNCNQVRSDVLSTLTSGEHYSCLVEDTTDAYPLFNAKKRVSDADMVCQRARYFDVLSKSRFALAPKGAGLSSIRQYEAMAFGCVPVILSDSLKQPFCVDWASCSIHVSEANVADIPEILLAVEPDFPAMSEAAVQAYDQLMDKSSYWAYIEDALGDIYKNNMDMRETVSSLRREIVVRAARGAMYRRKQDVKRILARINVGP